MRVGGHARQRVARCSLVASLLLTGCAGGQGWGAGEERPPVLTAMVDEQITSEPITGGDETEELTLYAQAWEPRPGAGGGGAGAGARRSAINGPSGGAAIGGGGGISGGSAGGFGGRAGATGTLSGPELEAALGGLLGDGEPITDGTTEPNQQAPLTNPAEGPVEGPVSLTDPTAPGDGSPEPVAAPVPAGLPAGLVLIAALYLGRQMRRLLRA